MSANKIKELRQLTGAGFLDCKKVLEQTNGDIDKAVEILREKGLAAAAKKAGRQTAEGIVEAYLSDNGQAGVLVEINCETDFVAKTDNFRSFVQEIAAHICQARPSDLAELEKQPFSPANSIAVGELVKEKIAQFGENISIRRFALINREQTGTIDAYIHGMGKIGVLVEVGCETESVADSADFQSLAHDIAMHIAAANPICIAEDDMDPKLVDSERKILLNQAINEGKPREIAEKVVAGRLAKYIKEVCLLEQPFVKEPEISVGQLLAQKGSQFGAAISIRRFVRYERGQGLEKKEDNFAAEVAKLQQN